MARATMSYSSSQLKQSPWNLVVSTSFLRQAVVHQNAKPVRESRKISISFEHLFVRHKIFLSRNRMFTCSVLACTPIRDSGRKQSHKSCSPFSFLPFPENVNQQEKTVRLKPYLEPFVLFPLLHRFGVLILRQIFLIHIGIVIFYTWVHFLPWECCFHPLGPFTQLAEVLRIIIVSISHSVHSCSSEGTLKRISLCVVLICGASLEVVFQLTILNIQTK